MNNKIQRKDPVSDTISALLVSNSITEAAELLKIDRTTIYKRMEKYPEIKETVDKISDYSHMVLKLASVKAANTLIALLDRPDSNIRYKAAIEILNRVGIRDDSANVYQQVIPILGGLTNAE